LWFRLGNAPKTAQIASNRKEKAPLDGSKGLFVFRRFAIIATSRCTAFKFYIGKAAGVKT
jgi:hypothetical protein